MSFIKNLKSGVITEVHNMDVINHCKKCTDEYAVTDDEPAGIEKAVANKTAPAEPKAEEAVKEIETESEETNSETAAEDNSEATGDYNSLSVAELRKVAKSKGIQGYANMNKETLVAVIEAHE